MSGSESSRPEWTPDSAGREFASTVMGGVQGGHDGMPGKGLASFRKPAVRRRSELSLEEYVGGIRSGNRTTLGRAITLIESNAPRHQAVSQQLLQAVSGSSKATIRVGITGVPGAGKSTTIDALGEMLCERGHKVAVLAVDPSSSLTKGSILGDKTRMERLARNPSAFIRPSPTGGCLGGVARKTRETLQLCEAFGFDVILLETVGVGQSEVTVRSMVDFFMLILISGAGDELQGIKKGVVELADAIVINKADGDNEQRARMAKAEFSRVLSFLQPATEGWKTKSHLLSAISGKGLPEIWDRILHFVEVTQQTGIFEQRRTQQNLEWMQTLLEEALRRKFLDNPQMRERIRTAGEKVTAGSIPAVKAVEEILDGI